MNAGPHGAAHGPDILNRFCWLQTRSRTPDLRRERSHRSTSLDCFGLRSLDFSTSQRGQFGGFDGKYHDGATGTCGASGCCRLARSREKTEAQTEGRVFGSLCAGVLSPGVIAISARLKFFNSQQKLTKAGLSPQVHPVLCTFKVPN